MGLDSYLRLVMYPYSIKEKKISKKVKSLLFNNNFFKSQDIVNSLEKDGEELFDLCCIKFEFMYWRKANAIHRWFVEKCQDGDDDCKYYEVSDEQLQKLLNIINEILKDKKKAPDLLPTGDGFFFGGKEYDEGYFEDLKYTKEKLEFYFDNIKEFEGFSLEYHSSW